MTAHKVVMPTCEKNVMTYEKINVFNLQVDPKLENSYLLKQQKTVKEYNQRQYSVNDLQREKLLENSRVFYSIINRYRQSKALQ